ncbi:uncharacterized protein NPIL_462761 [Nephila pilipes]|uniref:Gustatory receptor n=1 Tax=Nephila pilipes TaxID=299642 RepID=A0A8X6TUI4_NEPPI|nr:uncharacterized protein NPIL_462761 [Nephila pilipes]
MNKRKRSSECNYNGKVVPIIPVTEDDEEKRDSELLRQMHPLLIAFMFAGLDFRPQSARGCDTSVTYRERSINILLAIINIISWLYASIAIYGTIAIEGSMPMKHYISSQFVEILTIFLRSVLYWRRKDITNNLRHLSDAYDKIKHKSKNLNKGVISVLVVVFPGVYIIAYVLVLLTFISEGEMLFKNFLRKRYFNIIPLTLSSHVYYLLGINDVWLFSVNNVPVCLFIILMFIVCTILCHILQDYCKSINSSGATFEVLQRRHIAEMNTVKMVDKCLSFPLFILLGFHILLLFFIVAFFNSKTNFKHGPSVEKIFYYAVFILYSIQYFVITIFAAKVHEEVQNIKTEVAKMDGRPTQLTAVEQLLLIAKVNSHSNICLTVWGFLNITKNFVFSSIGALLTFGALFRDL